MGARRRSGHARRRRRGRFGPAGLARQHRHSLIASFQHLLRRPASSLMTVCVLGVALALPAGLLVGVYNLERLGTGWLAPDEAAVFLAAETQGPAAEAIRAQLADEDGVREAALISPEQALQEFRARSGLGEALDALAENPLPWVVTLVLNGASAERGALLERIQQRPDVDLVQYDRLWAERFQGLLAFVGRAAWVTGAVLVLAVFLTVGNTIRLDIGSRRDEIEVSRLVGATDAFIRRPFLYGGLWYGLAAGLAAALLVSIAVWLLQAPLDRLGAAYGTTLRLRGLGVTGLGLLVGVGGAIGWLGSGLAVARHLARIQPR